MANSEGRDLPTGVVTLMFTDVESSTRLLAALGERYVGTLADHRRILRAAAVSAGGVEVDTQGDAFFFAFPTADSALTAAVAMQVGLARHDWAGDVELRVRIGLHTGRPTRTDEGYAGLDLHCGARISSAGHGGQVVLSSATHEQARGAPAGARFRPLGAHRLKDLDQPITLFDLFIEGLPADHPALRSIGARPTNLPTDLVSLVGRHEDIEAGIAILSSRDRLLTLTGSGGTGKTSLAAHIALRLLPAFPDGAFVVWLASVQSPQFVTEAVASTLGLREGGGGSIGEVLMNYLAECEMLLVLDNFEHVGAATPLVEEMLRAAPGLRVLVTSRIPLRVGGEVELPILPLALDAGGAGRSPAVELFLVSGPGSPARVGVRRHHARRDQRDLHEARRPAAGDRARSRTSAADDAAGHARPVGEAVGARRRRVAQR